jgi:hypothetical protein
MRWPADPGDVWGRAERIARLRAAVEAESYAPDPYLVARALIDAGVL